MSYFCQEDVTPVQAATEKGEFESYLLVGNNQVFLVIDTEIVCELEKEVSTLGLISSFCVFNIQYTKGCRNFLVLEKLVLDISDKVLVSVSMFLLLGTDCIRYFPCKVPNAISITL